MLYFANPSTQWVRDAMHVGLLGCIVAPLNGSRFPEPHVVWCADNGCFNSDYPGDEYWFRWLESFYPEARHECLFATAPDVVGDAAATLGKAHWLPKIRSLGYPAAFVAQDGLEDLEIPWDEFDVLFIGGSTDWKLGGAAREIARETKARGKHLHMGRVNSLKRLRYARSIGVDSCDGTFIAFAPDWNLKVMLRWLVLLQQEPKYQAHA